MEALLIVSVMTFLIDGQENVTVNFVTDIETYCGNAIGCAWMDGSRQVFIQPGWGDMTKLITHEVAHIATGMGDTAEFRDKVDYLYEGGR